MGRWIGSDNSWHRTEDQMLARVFRRTSGPATGIWSYEVKLLGRGISGGGPARTALGAKRAAGRLIERWRASPP